MNAHPFSEYNPFRTILPYDEDGSLPTVYCGELDGAPAWSSRHFLVVGPPPERTDVLKTRRDFQKIIDGLPADMQEITPLAFEWDGLVWVVIFSDREHVLNAQYFDAARLICPDAQFFSGSKQTDPVLVKDAGGRRIALICGRRTKAAL
jgi:hypothetical protein